MNPGHLEEKVFQRWRSRRWRARRKGNPSGERSRRAKNNRHRKGYLRNQRGKAADEFVHVVVIVEVIGLVEVDDEQSGYPETIQLAITNTLSDRRRC